MYNNPGKYLSIKDNETRSFGVRDEKSLKNKLQTDMASFILEYDDDIIKSNLNNRYLDLLIHFALGNVSIEPTDDHFVINIP